MPKRSTILFDACLAKWEAHDSHPASPGVSGQKGPVGEMDRPLHPLGQREEAEAIARGDEPVAIQTQSGLCRIIVRYGKTDPSPFDIVLNGLDYTDCIPMKDASFPAGAKDHLSSGSMISNMIPSGSRK